MNILLATYWQIPHFGGVWTLMNQIKERLELMGHRVDLFGNSEGNLMLHMPNTHNRVDKRKLRQLLDVKMPATLFPTLHFDTLINYYEMECLCMELAAAYFGLDKYDVIHTHDIFSTRAFSRAKSPKTVLIASIHGSAAYEIKHKFLIQSPDSYLWKYLIMREHLGAVSSDVTIASSQWMKNCMVNEFSVPSRHIKVFPYGYDIEAFERQAALWSPLPRPTKGEKVIIYTSRMVELKGPRILLNALTKLKGVRSDWVCWMVGDGDQEDEFRRLSFDLGLQQHVHFYGRRDDVPFLLANADIYVHPSMLDNQPFSLIEAQLAGVPSIVSDATGVPEMVRDGETGFILPVGDIQAISNHLNLLLENEAFRKQMGRNAQLWARKHWALDKMISQFLNVYQEALAQKGR
ncbi:glycosyltransferase family 4 protein [Paenibacillus frigoriresistens]|uniref:glycosyltransferase family 4 protein n=1 Tax=Paenibacillus alginolyticus TaxID=59839 RepID=UPI001565A7E5|nr:glycosyltransferase family 4 protein [Paenibacillus frigoriresistens]NRF95271.1 glycosyltransferase family 4 protein [Paenibacillus frigoriresistens]